MTTPATTSATTTAITTATTATTSSPNIFQEVLTDASAVQDNLLGPTYPYYQNIKNPAQIGITDNGTLSALGDDISGLIDYVEVLVSGNSKASATGGPLGNKFFLQTGAKCMDSATNTQVDRYIYVNNVPSGNIPFISSGMGVDFTDFRGLIPGTMSNLNVLNPYTIMQSFLSGSTPPCQNVTFETIDTNNNVSSESHYVTLVDLQNMDACSFPNGNNPYSGKKCNETFVIGNRRIQIEKKEIEKEKEKEKEKEQEKDLVIQLFYICLAMLGLFFLFRISKKMA